MSYSFTAVFLTKTPLPLYFVNIANWPKELKLKDMENKPELYFN